MPQNIRLQVDVTYRRGLRIFESKWGKKWLKKVTWQNKINHFNRKIEKKFITGTSSQAVSLSFVLVDPHLEMTGNSKNQKPKWVFHIDYESKQNYYSVDSNKKFLCLQIHILKDISYFFTIFRLITKKVDEQVFSFTSYKWLKKDIFKKSITQVWKSTEYRLNQCFSYDEIFSTFH